MTTSEYLKAVLDSQAIKEGSTELEDLREHREAVEKLLWEKFPDAKLTIRYGGSKAKGTMIVESFDLDIISYFDNGDTSAGTTLEEIYENVAKALGADYAVEKKTSALRLKSMEKIDFHIDVVPGRFTDDSKTDAFLYISTGEKKRLKTNLQVHVDHVKNSGVIEALRLTKLWRVRNALKVRNFILELITIDLLNGKMTSTLEAQVKHFFKELVAVAESITVKDPANPEGNDLSSSFTEDVRSELKTVANHALEFIESEDWVAVFGLVPEAVTKEAKREKIRQAVASVAAPSKPWAW